MTARASDSSAESARQAARDLGSVGAATTGVGAVVVTLVAGACCVSPVLAPLIVGVLGASGAVWAASLKPYTWYILGASGAALAFGFWSVYRARAACAVGDVPRRSRVLSRVAALALWAGAVCWAAALVLRLALPQF
ncbi:MAG TPA: hypothetical protein VII52_11520, partial [Gemmatimonadaceae bacterium]